MVEHAGNPFHASGCRGWMFDGADRREFLPRQRPAEGRADREPIAPNDSAEGRAKNRRIEIILVKEQGQ